MTSWLSLIKLRLVIRCIDQNNVGERTHQVGFMGRIYARCIECIVYLGANLDGTAAALTEPPPVLHFNEDTVPQAENLQLGRKPDIYEIFLLFQELSQGGHPRKTLAFGNTSEVSTADRWKTNDRTDLFEALRRFTHAPFTPWWTRIWVVQEIAVPPQAVIVYGTVFAPWTMFANAARKYMGHNKTSCQCIPKGMPRDELKVLEDSCDMMISIDDLRRAQQSHRENFHNDLERLQPPLLLDLLIAFRDRKASDPRDKVYALLSMARTQEGKAPLIPDYSSSEIEVFRQATLESIYATEDLSLFSTELGRKFRDDLPTWVPDWGAPGGSMYASRAEALELYNASPGKATRSSVQPIGQDALVLEAKRIETVRYVGEVMWGYDAKHNQRTLTEWWHMLRGLDSEFKTGSVLPLDLWRVLCADIMYFPQLSNSRRRTQFTDELMFITWARLSKLSPFQNETIAPTIWSKEAIMWMDLVILWPNAMHLSFIDDEDTSTDFCPYMVPDGTTALMDQNRNVALSLIDALKELHWDYLNMRMEPRKEGPWRRLFAKGLKTLREHFGSDVHLDLGKVANFIPAVNESIDAATFSRRLIVGPKCVGLGPAGTAVGDQIFLLTGGKTPFMLRWRERDAIYPSQQKYEIVGDCYVHGRMDGEAKEENWIDSEGILLV